MKKYPNYRYFGRLLSHLTPAVSGEIFGWKYWLLGSKIFYPTLGGSNLNNLVRSRSYNLDKLIGSIVLKLWPCRNALVQPIKSLVKNKYTQTHTDTYRNLHIGPVLALWVVFFLYAIIPRLKEIRNLQCFPATPNTGSCLKVLHRRHSG